MTLEEKRALLNQHCGSTRCVECLLRVCGWSNPDYGQGWCHIDDRPEEDLDIALKIIGVKVDTERPDYWANVCEIQERQTEKGLSKYGQRLEDNESLSPIERLEYLEEELIDGLMYIEHIKAAFRKSEVGVSVEDLKKARDTLDAMISKIEEVEK